MDAKSIIAEHGQRGPDASLHEVVMGLHWSPIEPDASGATKPANLDAMCALLDTNGHTLELVRPAHAQNASGSISHTGESAAGASVWDDERIFVFLDALPQAVQALTFVVASVDGRPFCDIAGASCHVSNHRTEETLISVDLTALGRETAHSVATLQRTPTGWQVHSGPPLARDARLQEILLQRSKSH